MSSARDALQLVHYSGISRSRCRLACVLVMISAFGMNPRATSTQSGLTTASSYAKHPAMVAHKPKTNSSKNLQKRVSRTNNQTARAYEDTLEGKEG
jgi:hypothetical protein